MSTRNFLGTYVALEIHAADPTNKVRKGEMHCGPTTAESQE